MNTPKTSQAEQATGAPDAAGKTREKVLSPKEESIHRILELSIREEVDRGNDPYNNTGQHVILKLRENARR